MPNGQSILVKCEVKSRGGDVFDMIVAHSNLMEHFYFGLAYIDGKKLASSDCLLAWYINSCVVAFIIIPCDVPILFR